MTTVLRLAPLAVQRGPATRGLCGWELWCPPTGWGWFLFNSGLCCLPTQLAFACDANVTCFFYVSHTCIHRFWIEEMGGQMRLYTKCAFCQSWHSRQRQYDYAWKSRLTFSCQYSLAYLLCEWASTCVHNSVCFDNLTTTSNRIILAQDDGCGSEWLLNLYNVHLYPHFSLHRTACL